MPLYEYQCDACGHRFEVIQKYSDPLVDTCPKCGSTVRKLISSPAIQFKGSGFYITDYPKKESGGGPKSSGGAKDKDPSASSESSGDKGSDKPLEKTSDKAGSGDTGKSSDAAPAAKPEKSEKPAAAAAPAATPAKKE